MLLPQSPAMLEVPNPTEHVSPGQEALETAGGEGTGEEGEARRRKSSFSLHLDAFKKSAYRPRHNFTVRKSRYEIDDDEIAEPKPLAERSLHILHRHKTQRLRQRHTTKTDGKKHGHHHSATDLIRKLRKGGSGTNLAGQNGGAQGNEGKRDADAIMHAEPESLHINDGATEPAADVKFSIEDEGKEKETNF